MNRLRFLSRKSEMTWLAIQTWRDGDKDGHIAALTAIKELATAESVREACEWLQLGAFLCAAGCVLFTFLAVAGAQ